MVYYLQLNQSEGPTFAYLGTTLDVASMSNWLGAGVVLAVGAVLFELVRRRFMQRWSVIQVAIEADIKRQEATR